METKKAYGSPSERAVSCKEEPEVKITSNIKTEAGKWDDRETIVPKAVMQVADSEGRSF